MWTEIAENKYSDVAPMYEPSIYSKIAILTFSDGHSKFFRKSNLLVKSIGREFYAISLFTSSDSFPCLASKSSVFRNYSIEMPPLFTSAWIFLGINLARIYKNLPDCILPIKYKRENYPKI
jgi:hypothetical protein